MSVWVNGDFTPYPQLRSYSGREHTDFILIQAANDDDDDGEKQLIENPCPLQPPACLLQHAWDIVNLFYPRAHTGVD